MATKCKQHPRSTVRMPIYVFSDTHVQYQQNMSVEIATMLATAINMNQRTVNDHILLLFICLLWGPVTMATHTGMLVQQGNMISVRSTL